MSKGINLQDLILNSIRKDNSPITIYLVSGIQLKGYVKGFDSFTILLENDGKQQLIYKHAVSTIVPHKSLNLNFQNNPNNN
ncbi:host factor-I protein [Anaerobranca californiensis DSM 14826]|uniref:RNA-binding protein Hfq n=1 Tax=Anaerobranca californiensis DSM 14826 TaxID=1120989 RepID=A0A1M6K9W8_9FIRM|nr:RNA chaperone Hfq [Anaerobranca californiensis]SHJ55712.1 host factor-I protein [Anaerobranca californiensis DSM 14826]